MQPGPWEGLPEERDAGADGEWGGDAGAPVGLLVAPQTQELGHFVGVGGIRKFRGTHIQASLSQELSLNSLAANKWLSWDLNLLSFDSKALLPDFCQAWFGLVHYLISATHVTPDQFLPDLLPEFCCLLPSFPSPHHLEFFPAAGV